MASRHLSAMRGQLKLELRALMVRAMMKRYVVGLIAAGFAGLVFAGFSLFESEAQVAKKRAVESAEAPKAIGPYSQGVVANGFVYTAGQIGVGPEDGDACRGRHRGADRAGVEKYRGGAQGGGKFDGRCREDDCFPRGHERFYEDERDLREVFQAAVSRKIDGAGGEAAEGCEGGDRGGGGRRQKELTTGAQRTRRFFPDSQ